GADRRPQLLDALEDGHPTPRMRLTPPSMTRVCPVIQAASAEAKNATAPATSSGSPRRPSAYPAAASSSRPSYSALANFVLTTAGAPALTRTVGASSNASCAVTWMSAALLAAYQPRPGATPVPAIEATLTIAPPFFSSDAAYASRAQPI